MSSSFVRTIDRKPPSSALDSSIVLKKIASVFSKPESRDFGLLFLPHAEPAKEGVFVAAESCPGRQLFQQFVVAPAEHHVIGIQRRFQLFCNFTYVLAPFFLAKPFDSAQPEIIFISFFILIK